MRFFHYLEVSVIIFGNYFDLLEFIFYFCLCFLFCKKIFMTCIFFAFCFKNTCLVMTPFKFRIVDYFDLNILNLKMRFSNRYFYIFDFYCLKVKKYVWVQLIHLLFLNLFFILRYSQHFVFWISIFIWKKYYFVFKLF